MKRTICLMGIMAICLSAAVALAGDVVYVRSVKAKIMSEPRFDSEVKGSLHRGDRMDVIERAGSWYHVRSGDLDGWVSRLCLSENPPMKKVTVITGRTDTLQKSARRRVSAITSAAAARGLTEAGRERLNEENPPDYEALDKLVAFAGKISMQEVEEFSSSKGD